jgi:hypothetical protein
LAFISAAIAAAYSLSNFENQAAFWYRKTDLKSSERSVMPVADPNLLQSFHRFVGKQLELESGSLLTPDEALALWHEEQATLAAVREGLADVAAGRTKSLDEFERDMRQKYDFLRRA